MSLLRDLEHQGRAASKTLEHIVKAKQLLRCFVECQERFDYLAKNDLTEELVRQAKELDEYLRQIVANPV